MFTCCYVNSLGEAVHNSGKREDIFRIYILFESQINVLSGTV